MNKLKLIVSYEMHDHRIKRIISIVVFGVFFKTIKN